MMMERLLLAGLLMACSHGGIAWWFFGAGQDAELAVQAREDKARQSTEGIVATAIAAIKVNHVTNHQLLEREVRTREVFRDCRSGPTAVELFNGSIAGKRAGNGVVPSASAPR